MIYIQYSIYNPQQQEPLLLQHSSHHFLSQTETSVRSNPELIVNLSRINDGPVREMFWKYCGNAIALLGPRMQVMKLHFRQRHDSQGLYRRNTKVVDARLWTICWVLSDHLCRASRYIVTWDHYADMFRALQGIVVSGPGLRRHQRWPRNVVASQLLSRDNTQLHEIGDVLCDFRGSVFIVWC